MNGYRESISSKCVADCSKVAHVCALLHREQCTDDSLANTCGTCTPPTEWKEVPFSPVNYPCAANCTDFPPDLCKRLNRQECASNSAAAGCGDPLPGYRFVGERGVTTPAVVDCTWPTPDICTSLQREPCQEQGLPHVCGPCLFGTRSTFTTDPYALYYCQTIALGSLPIEYTSAMVGLLFSFAPIALIFRCKSPQKAQWWLVFMIPLNLLGFVTTVEWLNLAYRDARAYPTLGMETPVLVASLGVAGCFVLHGLFAIPFLLCNRDFPLRSSNRFIQGLISTLVILDASMVQLRDSRLLGLESLTVEGGLDPNVLVRSRRISGVMVCSKFVLLVVQVWFSEQVGLLKALTWTMLSAGTTVLLLVFSIGNMCACETGGTGHLRRRLNDDDSSYIRMMPARS